MTWTPPTEPTPTLTPALSLAVNRNRGAVLQVEEVVGRIAQDLVRAWGTTKE